MPAEMESRHPVTLVVAISIIVVALLGTLHMMRRADAKVEVLGASDVRSGVPVDIVVLRSVDLPRTIEARGFLRGIDEITVHSEVTGRVVSCPAVDGDRVEAGDILLVVDDTFYQLALRRAEAELKRAQSSLAEASAGVTQAEAQSESARAVLDNRGQEYARIEKLLASDNASQIEYDRMAVALRTAQADDDAARAARSRVVDQRSLAEATVESTEAALGEAKAHLERCVVRSPISGRVDRFFVDTGEYVVATTPLVEVIRLDRMKMIVELADTKIRLLDSFEKAEVTADAIGGAVHTATLHHVAPKMDPVSRKFRVELHVDNRDESLLSGMYGKAVIRAGSLTGVLRLPREAVFKHYGVDHCLIVSERDEDEGATARLRRLDVRDIEGRLEDLQVLAGVQEGDRVIVSQRRELREGVLVTVGKTLPDDGIVAGTP